MHPYNTASYNTHVLEPVTDHFASLDMFAKEYYVAVGGNRWYYQHTSAPQPNANRCPKAPDINILPQSNLPPLITTTFILPSSASFTDTVINCPVYPSNLVLDCVDK